jgi:hypothetical protein
MPEPMQSIVARAQLAGSNIIYFLLGFVVKNGDCADPAILTELLI